MNDGGADDRSDIEVRITGKGTAMNMVVSIGYALHNSLTRMPEPPRPHTEREFRIAALAVALAKECEIEVQSRVGSAVHSSGRGVIRAPANGKWPQEPR